MQTTDKQTELSNMELSVRAFEPSDYPKLCKWWLDWKKEPIPLNWLSTTGIIVSQGEKDIAAVFLYLTNSGMCFIENLVSDLFFPDKKIRQEALKKVIRSAFAEAKRQDRAIAFAQSNTKFVNKIFLELGFETIDQPVTNFFKQVA